MVKIAYADMTFEVRELKTTELCLSKNPSILADGYRPLPTI